MKGSIVCLAAGKSQTPLIRKAKSLGYLIVAVDRDESAIGMKYADTKICQSTYDAEAIIKEKFTQVVSPS